jgi:tRNA uridine 5-carboxymethylaminomethyl modification enzyme
MTYTSLEVHDILREGFDRSPMFNGRIRSLGPRYCPSIEDKINPLPIKRHQLLNLKDGKRVKCMSMVFYITSSRYSI